MLMADITVAAICDLTPEVMRHTIVGLEQMYCAAWMQFISAVRLRSKWTYLFLRMPGSVSLQSRPGYGLYRFS
jgi:hypothetical protein